MAPAKGRSYANPARVLTSGQSIVVALLEQQARVLALASEARSRATDLVIAEHELRRARAALVGLETAAAATLYTADDLRPLLASADAELISRWSSYYAEMAQFESGKLREPAEALEAAG